MPRATLVLEGGFHEYTWNGSVRVPAAFVAGGAEAYLRRIAVVGIPSVVVRLSASATADPEDDGPEFTPAFETAVGAFTFEKTDGTTVSLNGPGHSGNTFSDPTEPYFWTPPDRAFADWFTGGLVAGDVTLTLYDGVDLADVDLSADFRGGSEEHLFVLPAHDRPNADRVRWRDTAVGLGDVTPLLADPSTPTVLSRFQVNADNGRILMRVGGDGFGGGQELLDAWETAPGAVAVRVPGLPDLTIRGPAEPGNTTVDATEPYSWVPGDAGVVYGDVAADGIRRWVTDFLAAHAADDALRATLILRVPVLGGASLSVLAPAALSVGMRGGAGAGAASLRVLGPVGLGTGLRGGAGAGEASLLILPPVPMAADLRGGAARGEASLRVVPPPIGLAADFRGGDDAGDASLFVYVPGDISEDERRLAVGAVVNLFTLDARDIGGGLHRYVSGPWNGAPVRHGGVEYSPTPIRMTGARIGGEGPPARPRLTVSRLDAAVAAALVGTGEWRGARLTRIRTLTRYLDGEPSADPLRHWPAEVYLVQRLASASKDELVWDLASPLDVDRRKLPGRQILRDVCGWRYRRWDGVAWDYGQAECPYDGADHFDAEDNPVADAADDKCSRRISGCRLRFPDRILPFGGFVGVGRGR